MSDLENTQSNYSPERGDDEKTTADLLMTTEYPELDYEVLFDDGDENVLYELAARLKLSGDPPLTEGDLMRLNPRWKIEQRLAAINDARDGGAITPETADKLELATLRELRNFTLENKYKIPTNIAHEIAEKSGNAPLNVPRP